jgi:hypothetical protein
MRAVVVLVAVALLLSVAAPALAQQGAERAGETAQPLMDAYLPPGYGEASGIDALDPYGVATHLYLYDLAAICHNYGGYYYWGGHGYYWHDCAGAQH